MPSCYQRFWGSKSYIVVPEYDPYRHLDTNAFGAVNPILWYLNMTPIDILILTLSGQ